MTKSLSCAVIVLSSLRLPFCPASVLSIAPHLVPIQPFPPAGHLQSTFRRLAVTLCGSHCYKLFVVAKNVNSFAIKQIHTLLPKQPAWGMPLNCVPADSATNRLIDR